MPTSIPIGGLGLTLLSCCLTATVVGNAYYQKKQFYPSVVYITKSNPSMAAIYLMAFTMVILFGKLLKKIFFGTLRPAEYEHLIERFFYAVTETCLAFTVFRDDFSPKFVALFTVLLFLKAFHWLADYRVDYMERSPVISGIFHIRVASLLVLLSTIDILLVRHAYHSTMSLGASVQLVFGFEYAILLTGVYNIGVKYLCHGIEMHSENPWENKAMYLLYMELFVGFIRVMLYVAFLLIMVRIHTFPLFIIRPMYLTMKSFKKALQDMLQSRRAIHNMNTLYPNASPQDLQQSDNVCIICREEMTLNTGVKKLPCLHLFHALCLRSWFQRQQTCPTCRLDVLRQPAQPPPAAAQAQQAAPAGPQANRRQPANMVELMQQLLEQQRQQQQQQQQQPPPPAAAAGNTQQLRQNAAAAPGGAPFAPFPLLPPQLLHQILQQHNALHTAQQQQASSSSTTTTTTTTSSTTATSTISNGTTNTSAAPSTTTTTTDGSGTTAATAATTAPLLLPPPFTMLPPFMGAVGGAINSPFPNFSLPPMPRPPPNYSGLTQGELEAMEGRLRPQVEARLTMLRDTEVILHAAIVQLTQYTDMMARLDATVPLVQPSATSTSAPSTSVPSTSASSTSAPSTSAPSTSAPSTSALSTSAPSISAPSISASTVSTASFSASDTPSTPVASAPGPPSTTSTPSTSLSPAPSSADRPQLSPDYNNSSGVQEEGGTAHGTTQEVRRRRLEKFDASDATAGAASGTNADRPL